MIGDWDKQAWKPSNVDKIVIDTMKSISKAIDEQSQIPEELLGSAKKTIDNRSGICNKVNDGFIVICVLFMQSFDRITNYIADRFMRVWGDKRL